MQTNKIMMKNKLIPKHQNSSGPLILKNDNTTVTSVRPESIHAKNANPKLWEEYLKSHSPHPFDFWLELKNRSEQQSRPHIVLGNPKGLSPEALKAESDENHAKYISEQNKKAEQQTAKVVMPMVGIPLLAVSAYAAPVATALSIGGGFLGDAIGEELEDHHGFKKGTRTLTGLAGSLIAPGITKVPKIVNNTTTSAVRGIGKGYQVGKNYVYSRVPYFGNNIVSRGINTVRHKLGTPQQPELLRKINTLPKVTPDGKIIISGNRFYDEVDMHKGITNFTTDRPVTPHHKHKRLDEYELFVINPNKIDRNAYVSIDPSDTFIKTDTPVTLDPSDVTVITGNPEFIAWAKHNKVPYYTNRELLKLYLQASKPFKNNIEKAVKLRDQYKPYGEALEQAYRSRTIPTYADYIRFSEQTGLPLRMTPYSEYVTNANPYGWRDRGTWRNVYYDSSTPVESAYRTWIKNNPNSSKYDFWDWYLSRRPGGRRFK